MDGGGCPLNRQAEMTRIHQPTSQTDLAVGLKKNQHIGLTNTIFESHKRHPQYQDDGNHKIRDWHNERLLPEHSDFNSVHYTAHANNYTIHLTQRIWLLQSRLIRLPFVRGRTRNPRLSP